MDVITFLEIVGTVTGVTHLWLLTRQKISAWIFGIISVGIYIYITYDVKYYSGSILNLCFIGLNCFGWYNWSRQKAEVVVVKVTRLSRINIAFAVIIIAAGTVLWGSFMGSSTDADLPYPDAFAAIASLVAQYLLTQKKIDNWVIWIIVDLVFIPMFIYKGLFISAGLYTLYLLLCISGIIQWRRELSHPVVPLQNANVEV